MYADRNLATMNYDFAIFDEKYEISDDGDETHDGQLTIEDFIGNTGIFQSDLQNIEGDGLEEITGNYIPDNTQ